MSGAGRVRKGWLGLAFALFAVCAQAQTSARPTPEAVLDARYRLVLDLVRHTATYSPPVASRAFAYLGVIGYEAMASGRPDMASLAGQLHGLTTLPKREPGAVYDEALVLDAALSSAIRRFFDNTGPTGQRAMKAMDAKYHARPSRPVCRPTSLSARRPSAAR